MLGDSAKQTRPRECEAGFGLPLLTQHHSTWVRQAPRDRFDRGAARRVGVSIDVNVAGVRRDDFFLRRDDVELSQTRRGQRRRADDVGTLGPVNGRSLIV
jgi:hypothetical protein